MNFEELIDGPDEFRPKAAEEPSGDMRKFGRIMRDMFVALVAEGFTEEQALSMLATTIAATIGANKR